MQALGAVAPSVVLYVPARQSKQMGNPGRMPCFPAGQRVQSPACPCASLNFPATQSVQWFDPGETAFFPAMQSMQSVSNNEPTVKLYLPASQVMQG